MCVKENGNYLTSVKYSILDGPELPELDLLTMKTVTFKYPDHCSENRDKVKVSFILLRLQHQHQLPLARWPIAIAVLCQHQIVWLLRTLRTTKTSKDKVEAKSAFGCRVEFLPDITIESGQTEWSTHGIQTSWKILNSMPAKLFNRYTQYFDTYFLSSFEVPNVES